jgi:hypothetical protein
MEIFKNYATIRCSRRALLYGVLLPIWLPGEYSTLSCWFSSDPLTYRNFPSFWASEVINYDPSCDTSSWLVLRSQVDTQFPIGTCWGQQMFRIKFTWGVGSGYWHLNEWNSKTKYQQAWIQNKFVVVEEVVVHLRQNTISKMAINANKM